MIGAIIGDIVGSRFEFNNYKNKDFELFTDECFVTDDSIMTLAVARAIMEAGKRKEQSDYMAKYAGDYYSLVADMTVKYMQEIGRQYPNCGYGRMFMEWVFSDSPRAYNSFGNGAAMRISPVGFAARSEDEVKKLSHAVTAVTHNHPEGIKGAEAVALAIFMARSGDTKIEIRNKINSSYYPLDFTIDQIRDSYEFNETCQGTCPQAIEAFLESTSFEDAIRTAISLGGDSDTVAAITGSIAEAYYGVPPEIRDRALRYLDNELRAIYDEWTEFIGSPSVSF
jgi:ADP-ribosyl-[dinitrogen reductase] hydrolase